MRVCLSWAAAALVYAVAAGTGQAGTVTYVTIPGGMTSGGAVLGEADVTLGNGTMNVTLTNLLTGSNFTGSNYNDALQISGVQITFAATPGPASLTSSDLAKFVYFDTNPATVIDNSAINHWIANSSGSIVTLTTLSGIQINGSGQPQQLIIGTGITTNQVNPSVVQHTPSISGSATFHLSVGGITAGSTIQSLTFQFGTDKDLNFVSGTPVPEPSTLVGGVVAVVVGLGVVSRRRGVQRAA